MPLTAIHDYTTFTFTVCVSIDEGAGTSLDRRERAMMTSSGRRRSIRAVFGRLLQNSALPKLIILTVSLCLVYVILRLSVSLLDVHRLSALGRAPS